MPLRSSFLRARRSPRSAAACAALLSLAACSPRPGTGGDGSVERDAAPSVDTRTERDGDAPLEAGPGFDAELPHDAADLDAPPDEAPAPPDGGGLEASVGDAPATPGDGGAVEAGSDAGCGGREECDGLDNNCDGRVDEGCPCTPGMTQRCYGGAPSLAGRGVCTYGTQACVFDGEFGRWGTCEGYGSPRAPTCTGVDDRCNGVIDEGCTCVPGSTRGCYTGPAGTDGVGACRAGVQRCVGSAASTAWGPCEGQQLPEPNRCDGVDRACTGDPMRGCACALGATRACYTGPMATRSVGACRDGTQRCVLGDDGSPAWSAACVGEVLPAGPNTCDGVDRACNGMPTMCPMGCTPGETRACYAGPAGTAGVGLCRAGTETCARGADGVGRFGPCVGQVVPAGPNLCDGVDRACNGAPMTDCACVPGAEMPCYPGPASSRGVGACRDGRSVCAGTPPMMGACTGAVLPTTERCNGADDNCDGRVDEGCGCAVGATTPCYTGPMASRARGRCRDGVFRCAANADGTASFGTTCEGQVLPNPTEICGNGIDDDCDGFVDCETCIDIGGTPWQMARTERPVCYDTGFAECGFPAEFDRSPAVPVVNDRVWQPVTDPQINFGTAPTSPDRRSRMPGSGCACRAGGDFTHFQTYFTLRENVLRPGFADVRDFRLRVARVNNGIRATLYNTRFPLGADVRSLYASSPLCDAAFISGETMGNMADLLAPGLNRIVITHLDDCGDERELTGVQLVFDGMTINECRREAGR